MAVPSRFDYIARSPYAAQLRRDRIGRMNGCETNDVLTNYTDDTVHLIAHRWRAQGEYGPKERKNGNKYFGHRYRRARMVCGTTDPPRNGHGVRLLALALSDCGEERTAQELKQ